MKRKKREGCGRERDGTPGRMRKAEVEENTSPSGQVLKSCVSQKNIFQIPHNNCFVPSPESFSREAPDRIDYAC